MAHDNTLGLPASSFSSHHPPWNAYGNKRPKVPKRVLVAHLEHIHGMIWDVANQRDFDANSEVWQHFDNNMRVDIEAPDYLSVVNFHGTMGVAEFQWFQFGFMTEFPSIQCKVKR